MAKAVRAKKSGVKAKTTKVAKTKTKAAKKKTARPAAKAPSKVKSPATKKKKTPAKARKPTTKKTVAKTPAKKTAAAKPAAKKSARRKIVAGKAKAAPKPKSPATPAPQPKVVVAATTDRRAAPAAPVLSALMPSRPAVGQKAPDFSLPADNGSTIGLASLAGKTVVLYFYPKDDTPGCTIEAIAFSNLRAAFEAVGAVVIGVSKDSVDAHCKFKGKHNLSIPLLSDESGKMLEKYGVWVEKNLYGRTYMGIDRTTFLLDGGGIVRRVWPKVKVEGHADEVLAAVKSL